jgi:hypothetical protein
MLGRAVSSSTPMDLQPRPTMASERPLMNCHGFSPGPTHGCAYCAVGMQRALESATGLPSIATSAASMLGFLTPADVRRSFNRASGAVGRDVDAVNLPGRSCDFLAVWVLKVQRSPADRP